MRHNETNGAAMIGGKRLAVVFESKENIGTSEVLQRDVGCVALFRKDENEFGAGFRLDPLEYIREENALPAVIEAAPTSDAVEIAGDLGLREGAKIVPGKGARGFEQTGDFEVPVGRVEYRDMAVVKDRPFEGEGLARRQAAFGSSSFFFFAASAVVSENGHRSSFLAIRFSHKRMVSRGPAPKTGRMLNQEPDRTVCYSWRMTAQILDGLKIRGEIFAELKEEIARLAAQGIRPGLAAVLVGANPASQLYVKSKIAACQELGLASWLHTPPANSSTEYMLQLVDDLNRDENVDGILVQLPLPGQVDSKKVLEAVSPAKDVDGFHPVSLGMLVSNRPGLVACTPAGCMEILRRYKIPIEGANAVVLGRSDIVGKPMALLLMHANATVTICHSKTRDLPEVVRRADIVVAAMGKAGFVREDWIKAGAAVIDVGTNKVTDAAEAEELLKNFPKRLEKFREKGNVLIGDVRPDAVFTAGAVSPVPGGVGPMTITMLMSNTVKAAKLRRGKSSVATR